MKPSEFERWLFDDVHLSAEQEQALANAMAVSPHMRSLAAGWRAAEAELLAAPSAAPDPGFSRRWLRRLRDGQVIRRQRQLGWAFGGTVLGALLSLGVLATLAIGSPAGLAAGLLEVVIGVVQLVNSGIRMTAALLDGTSLLAGLLLSMVTLAWLSVIWFASLYRFAFQGLPNGERK